jgi:hypothetical protein
LIVVPIAFISDVLRLRKVPLMREARGLETLTQSIQQERVFLYIDGVVKSEGDSGGGLWWSDRFKGPHYYFNSTVKSEDVST